VGGSKKPGPVNPPAAPYRVPARTPGPTGVNDHGDPNTTSHLGDTPGPVGVKDGGDPTLPKLKPGAAGHAGQADDGTALAGGFDHPPTAPGTYLWLQPEGDEGQWIPIYSYSFGSSNVTISGSSGKDDSADKSRDIHFTTSLNYAQWLMKLSTDGKLVSGTLRQIASEGKQVMGFSFTEGAIGSVQMGGSNTQFTLNAVPHFKFPASQESTEP